MDITFSVQEASKGNVEQLVEVGNAAFMADVFFKKPEYHLRFTVDRVLTMMDSKNSVFIVAIRNNSFEIVGCIYLHWELYENHDNQVIKVVGKFSAVSVPPKNEKQGIGKALVEAAANKVIQIANTYGNNVEADLEMGVINQRKDLFPWYEKQGFTAFEEIFDSEVDKIVLDELRGKVFCILMRKHLR